MTTNEKITAILNHYGATHQVMKAIEEMGELITALSRTACGRGSEAEIKEEVADVCVMMMQLMQLYGKEEIAGITAAKINRTLDRMKDEGSVIPNSL